MTDEIIVGPINRGLKTNREPFVIDNDSFPVLINAFQWRGRIRRKRGTDFLNRLTRYFDSTNAVYTSSPNLTLSSGSANLVTGFSLETNSAILRGSVSIFDNNDAQTYTDPASDGILTGSSMGTGTINYQDGSFTIDGGGAHTVSANFRYFPSLPVMGIEDFQPEYRQYPFTICFDTVYSYRLLETYPYRSYDISFYKNPTTGTYTNYTEKSGTEITKTSWNGDDYQQFWTENYQNAMWATNGIDIPYTGANIGMQFKNIANITNITNAVTHYTADIQINTHGLVVGDFLFFNELNEGDVQGFNFQTGYVSTVVDPNTVTVTFPNATLSGTFATVQGIAQYLTNRSDTSKDCLRYYDGDPTDGSATSPSLSGNKGWVNFCPPLSQSNSSIAGLPSDQYYLVGARMILEYKDRLLFIGPVVQTSSASTPIYLQDTVIYSQNGTPYYTASFTGDVNLADTVFNPLLVPTNQSAAPTAFFTDQTGFGGFISIGINEAIQTTAYNDDMVFYGTDTRQYRFAYTSNDIVPFQFYQINSELGSSSTFSTVNLGESVLTRGNRGFVETVQSRAERFDLEIPDSVYQMKLENNGAERVTAVRDYINEYIYFTYPANTNDYKFPTQTLFYNYRDGSWAQFNESYTTYGAFRRVTGLTWSQVGEIYGTWAQWNDPWNSGESTLLQPEVIAGNQQGYILARSEGTGEGVSLYISDITPGNPTVITSPSHSLNDGDHIVIKNVQGDIASQLNNKVFEISLSETNTFNITPSVTSGTYRGGGEIVRIYRPFIQTKQFPAAWGNKAKTLLGPQWYMVTNTANSQITLLVYKSQNPNDPWTEQTVLPEATAQNDAQIYSTVLYTCPQSSNLGLSAPNYNLNQAGGAGQSQIWQRKNNGCVGDTIQLGFTLSGEQLKDANLNYQFAEIELHGFILNVKPSRLLA